MTDKRERGAGMVYQRPGSRFWWCQFHVDGKPVRESTGKLNESQALGYLKARLKQVVKGDFFGLDTERLTVSDVVENLLRARKTRRHKSLDWDTRRWELHLKPFFGHTKARNVDKALIEKYIEARKEEGASDASVNRELAVLSKAVSETPGLPRLKFKRLDERGNARQGFLADADRQKLATECAKVGLWLRAMFELGSRYGFRKGELLKLRVGNVDLAERIVRLEGRATKNSEAKEVPLLADAYTLIEQCIVGKMPTDYVFSREDGEPVRDFRRVWGTVCKAAGVPDLLFHDLRRTAVRGLINSGVDRYTAMQITGHKTESVFNRYHIQDRKSKIAAIEKIYALDTVQTHSEGKPEGRKTADRPN
jgi:integrase